MSLQVRVSLAEHFLNWYTCTKLYIRGQKGKDWNAQRALDYELAGQLNEFFDKHGVTDLRERLAKAEQERDEFEQRLYAAMTRNVLDLKRAEAWKAAARALCAFVESYDAGDALHLYNLAEELEGEL